MTYARNNGRARAQPLRAMQPPGAPPRVLQRSPQHTPVRTDDYQRPLAEDLVKAGGPNEGRDVQQSPESYYPDRAYPCDPNQGKLFEERTQTGQAPLMNEAIAGPPARFATIAEAPGPNATQWVNVVQVTIPQGMTGRYVKVVPRLNEPAWSSAVDFAIWIGGSQIELTWRGQTMIGQWIPLRGATNGSVVSLRALVRQEFWSVGGPIAGTPIRDLLIAEGDLTVAMQSNTPNPGGC